MNITCTKVVKDGAGNVTSLVATVDASKERAKPKGHLHWLSVATAVPAEIRVYDVLFSPEDPGARPAPLAR